MNITAQTFIRNYNISKLIDIELDSDYLVIFKTIEHFFKNLKTYKDNINFDNHRIFYGRSKYEILIFELSDIEEIRINKKIYYYIGIGDLNLTISDVEKLAEWYIKNILNISFKHCIFKSREIMGIYSQRYDLRQVNPPS